MLVMGNNYGSNYLSLDSMNIKALMNKWMKPFSIMGCVFNFG